MRKLILGMLLVMGVVGLMAGTAMAVTSTDSADVNLLITPVVICDLNVSPTYYNFGSVRVKKSTCSVTALVLTNAGDVGITIDKTVWTDDAWDITKSSTSQDGFDLWAMVQAGAPGQVAYTTSQSSFNESGLQAINALTYDTKVKVDMSPTDTANLWFRLDMPRYVTSDVQRTIHVRLRANPK